MKKIILSRLIISTVVFLFVFKSFAFEYKISFTATGVRTSIDYVVVHNLTKGTTSTVTEGNLLELTALQQISANNESLKIYPNPIQNKATVSYFSNSGGNAQLSVIGIDGRSFARISKKLEMGENHFEITLPKGAYTLQIIDNGQIHSAKIISQSANTVGIEFKGSNKIDPQEPLKIKTTSVPMQYSIGDILIFKAYSGNYKSILTDIVSGDKTINFNFIECKDVDGNYYSTVTIGTQVWMAENLKTTKYRNNVTVTDRTNSTTWGTSTTEGLSDYATPTNSTTYGKLYNWYAVSSPNNLAPVGWHVPTDAEWTKLSDYLGGLSIAGDKLKENGNLHWLTSNITATNETGFTALPGGTRSTDNSIYDIGNIGYWWCETEGTTTNNAWYRSLSNQNSVITRGYFSKSGGMSVRCLMGDLPILSTTNASSITASGFASGGGVLFDGNYPVTSSGICWSTNENPTINDFKTSDWNGLGTFTSNVAGLSPETTYYVRAYATNSYGTGYGTQLTVSTSTPTVVTTPITAITANTAGAGGSVNIISGAAPITARGICWSTNENPTIADSKTSNGTGVGTFSSNLTGLAPETVYYVRAYAINGAGVNYGIQVSFSTKTPTINTTDVSTVTAISANVGGNVTAIGGAPVTARGICWNTSSNPTIALNTKTTNGTGTGVFSSSITGLKAATTYYVRAYATNSIGTSYGNEVNFTTQNGIINLITAGISSVSAKSATSGGSISSDGGAAVLSRGVCWSLNPNPTIELSTKTSNGTGTGVFTSSITGLTIGTTYYLRAYATNSIGTVYGNEITFSTNLPTVTTHDISSITATSALGGGDVTDNGGSTVSMRGICWSTTIDPTTSNSKTTVSGSLGVFTSAISGLTIGKTYYIRAYAINSIGTSYGSQVSFTTNLPTVTTAAISSITASSAVCGGSITAIGGSPVTTHGVCWSTSPSPTIALNTKTSDDTDDGNYTSSITGLTIGTTYYVRSYATNSIGTSYGNEITFSTNLPTLTTTNISNITANAADAGGNITDKGGSDIIERGICWSTNSNPTITDNKTIDGIGSGIFSSSITGLTIGKTYFVRAYATNSIGTSYGNETTFSTNLPTIITTNVSNITANTAISGGNITDKGGSIITEKGICWSLNPNPTIELSTKTSNGTGTGVFTSSITGLTIGTTYYLRAYATNSIGTVYGNEITFSTNLPTVTTHDISSITATSALGGGDVTDNGGSTVSMRGICWSTTIDPTTSNSKTTVSGSLGVFTSAISGLTIGKTYYIRAYAINSIGTSYGSQVSFTTNLPTVTTAAISSITASSAVCGGSITAIGGSPVTTHGVCWSTSPSPTIALNTKTSDDTDDGNYTSSITGLTIGTTYYVRSYATNSIGTSYGNEITFSTNLPTLTTTNISNITANAADAGGNITDKGGSDIIERGICWSTNSNPTITDNKTIDGIGSGIFSSSITGLTIGKTYFVRAYATNSIGTSYGNETTFSTNLPTIITTNVSNITANTAISGGNITDKGGSIITEKGICWSTSANPTLANNKTTDGTGVGVFSSSITGLAGVGSTYYVRSYATNSIGTSYGNEISFTVAALGTIFEDGYVFYLDGNGHGMICSLIDQSSGIRWAASTTRITYANGIEIGTGKSNTQKIVSLSYLNGNGAANLCNDLSPKGTWFLPSRKELKLMYTNLKVNNVGDFTDSSYWTSTESESISSRQWAEWVSFNNGASFSDSKTELRCVRAVRNF